LVFGEKHFYTSDYHFFSNFARLLKVSKGPFVTNILLMPGEIFPPGLTSNV
jgi:hypothetical protein